MYHCPYRLALAELTDASISRKILFCMKDIAVFLTGWIWNYLWMHDQVNLKWSLEVILCWGWNTRCMSALILSPNKGYVIPIYRSICIVELYYLSCIPQCGLSKCYHLSPSPLASLQCDPCQLHWQPPGMFSWQSSSSFSQCPPRQICKLRCLWGQNS